jgi:hypothetical protein
MFDKAPDQFVDRASGEFDDIPALGADEMVPVAGMAHDVSRKPTRTHEPLQEAEARQNLQRPVHRCATDIGEVSDDLLGSKWFLPIEHRSNNPASRSGCPVPMICKFRENGFECRRGWRLGHGDVHVAQRTISIRFSVRAALEDRSPLETRAIIAA